MPRAYTSNRMLTALCELLIIGLLIYTVADGRNASMIPAQTYRKGTRGWCGRLLGAVGVCDGEPLISPQLWKLSV